MPSKRREALHSNMPWGCPCGCSKFSFSLTTNNIAPFHFTCSKIASLKDPVALESALARSQTKLNQLKALREEKAANHAANKKAVHDEILEALAMVADHHSHCAKRFNEVKAVGQKVIDAIDQSCKAVIEEAANQLPPAPPS